MTTSGASAVVSSSTPLSLTPVSTVTAFTPLESFFLFQAIIQHGVEPESFVRIAAILQNNAFVRCDESYNADRLTPKSLQRLFLHLLEEDSDDGSNSKGDGDSKKRKMTPVDSRVQPERLQVLVERLYARYRQHIVDAIREDERRIEKVQHEIRVLEQQVVGGSGRGAHARAVAAAAAAEERKSQAAATALNGRQQTQTNSQAQAQTQTQTQARQDVSSKLPGPLAEPAASASQRDALSGVASLPATSRLGVQHLQIASAPAHLRDAASPALQRRPLAPPLQQQPKSASSSRLPPQLAPHLPPPSSHPPSRASTVVSTTSGTPITTPTTVPMSDPTSFKSLPVVPSDKTLLPKPASQPASPLLSAPRQPLQQTLLPSTAKPSHPPSQAPQAPLSQAPGPVSSFSSLSTPTTHPTVQPAAATASTAEPHTETPRPFVPITQKPSPIAPIQQPSGGQFQRLAAGTSTPTAPSTSHTGSDVGILARPLFPDHVRGRPPSRTPTPVNSPCLTLPHTPVHGMSATASVASFLPRGSGTRWKPSEPTPSTPGPDVGDMASPAYEPLSPVHAGAASRADSVDATDADTSSMSPSTSAPVQRQPRNLRKPHGTSSMKTVATQKDATASGASSRAARSHRPSRYARQCGDNTDDDGGSFSIKAEESTPKAFDDGTEDIDDTAAVSPRGGIASSRALLKRKRLDNDSEDLLQTVATLRPSLSVLARQRLVGPPAPPTHVLWMRGFPKISASALDQISSHRHANMFAHRIRDRDAPGYSSIVRHPVDLKSIRMAITHGNKAATVMAAALAESDSHNSLSVSGTSSVWLPISEDLVPPRGIINSSQLECELVHMFANAVMYNPDSHRGPGPAFLAGELDGDEEHGSGGAADVDNARYMLDEDGVVNDTRDMYVEVEKLLSEMRSAERQRGMPVPPPGARGLDLPLDEGELSAATAAVMGGDSTLASDGRGGRQRVGAKDEARDSGARDDGGDDDAGAGAVKRRRITRGQ